MKSFVNVAHLKRVMRHRTRNAVDLRSGRTVPRGRANAIGAYGALRREDKQIKKAMRRQ